MEETLEAMVLDGAISDIEKDQVLSYIEASIDDIEEFGFIEMPQCFDDIMAKISLYQTPAVSRFVQ